MKYRSEYTKEISFPLGGIGTGSIGLAGDGQLVDWEIFNRPAKGSINRHSHFAVKAIRDGKAVARVLHGDLQKDYIGQYGQRYGHGPDSQRLCGFPHFADTVFDGQFPVANVTFADEKFPGRIVLTAFNPFIPQDADNSSIPAAFFELEVTNTSDAPVTYQLAFSVNNPFEVSRNCSHARDGYRMITLTNAGAEKTDVTYGDLTVATDCDKVCTQTYWYRGGWQDTIVSFWNDFTSVEPMKDRLYDTDGKRDGSTIAAEVDVAAGESRKVRFVLSWNVPNNYNYWNEYKNEDGTHKTWKNYYATLFEDSAASAVYALKNWDSLYERTLRFKNALHGTTLPATVIDAAASNLSVLKSPTVLRLEDGSFYGWEGVNETTGSCEGTCQHVWNYAYALCFLFPSLERSIRDLEFKYSTDENGRMPFRLTLPVGREMSPFRACVDGQMGSVIKCYREWKISGDDAWLRGHWETIKKALEYAWSPLNPDHWDADKDGVLEGRQHHTLDMELFGPSSWLEGMYLAALKAAAEMAEYLGEPDKAREYRQVFEKGYAWTKEHLFNGKYFIQKLDVTDKSVLEPWSDAVEGYWNAERGQIKYQVADGSIIDQMLAQWHADLLGLGDIFDAQQVDTALTSMMQNNFKLHMREFVNPWRLYSLNEEAGTVICDYPEGTQKPAIPVPYCEETMTGFEYAFAGLLCARGKIEDGLKVTAAIRDRFDGKKRNPWNEFECGNNYARSMASYALIPILSGFTFDLPHGHIGFEPYTDAEGFRTVWSVGDAWGEYTVEKEKIMLSVCEGSLSLRTFGVKLDGFTSVEIDGKRIGFTKDGEKICFEPCTIEKTLVIYR